MKSVVYKIIQSGTGYKCLTFSYVIKHLSLAFSVKLRQYVIQQQKRSLSRYLLDYAYLRKLKTEYRCSVLSLRSEISKIRTVYHKLYVISVRTHYTDTIMYLLCLTAPNLTFKMLSICVALIIYAYILKSVRYFLMYLPDQLVKLRYEILSYLYQFASILNKLLIINIYEILCIFIEFIFLKQFVFLVYDFCLGAGIIHIELIKLTKLHIQKSSSFGRPLFDYIKIFR